MDDSRYNRYYANTNTFQYYNANPEGARKRGYVWDRGDCAIRALAKGAEITWLEAFDFLSKNARKDYNVVNDMGGFRKWLVGGGAEWIHCKAEKGKSRMTASEFALTHKEGRYVIEVANHFTACANGKIYDVWNCGEKAVCGYFEMKNFRITPK